jgi:hypothetical protein
MVDPEGLPGMYMARIVATLNNSNSVSSSQAPADRTRWSEDFIGTINGKSNVHLPLGTESPTFAEGGAASDSARTESRTSAKGGAASGPEHLEEQRRLDCDGRRLEGDGQLRENPSGIRKITGSGECQPELPDGSLLKLAASPERKKRDLQGVNSSLPVENRFGNQDDTTQNYLTCTETVKGARGQEQEIKVITQDTWDTEKIEENKAKMQKGTKGDHIVGFVPIHIINLSLEEITMKKHQRV